MCCPNKAPTKIQSIFFFLFLLTSQSLLARFPAAFNFDALQKRHEGFVEKSTKDHCQALKLFDKEHYLLGIDRQSAFSKDFERFVWQDGKLLRHWKLNQEHELLFYYDYEYNAEGLIVKESIFGNLSGTFKGPILLDEQGKVLQAEKYSISYSYYEDGSLFEEAHDNGKVLRYSYDLQTQKIQSIITIHHGKIFQRQFFRYDKEGREIESIIDNGTLTEPSSDFSQRLIYYSSYPSENKQIVEEFFEDFEGRFFIRASLRTIDAQGFVIEEEQNAQGKCRLVSKKQYDQGLLIFSEDALGQQERYYYDSEGNFLCCDDGQVVHSVKKSGNLVEFFDQDALGNLIKTSTLYDDDGKVLTKRDQHGNIQEYFYDGFGRLERERGSALYDETRRCFFPEKSYSYNAMDLLSVQINERGLGTHYQYNSRGQITQILFADSTSLEYEYFLDGRLRKEKARNGLSKVYQRDLLDRVTEEKMLDREGKPYFWRRSIYGLCSLEEQRDSSGLKLQYVSKAGRIKRLEESTGQQKKTSYFSHDSWGRLAEKKEQYGQAQYKTTRFFYDALDRIVEEHCLEQERVQERISYTYDRKGRQNSVIHHDRDGLFQASSAKYHLCGKIEYFINAIAEETKTSFDLSFVNDLGQTVWKETCIEPCGRQRETIYDVKGRPTQITIKDVFSTVLLQKEILYDADGNKARESDYFDGQVYCVLHQYGPEKKLRALIEGSGKKTEYFYDRFGDLAEKKLANGASIYFFYDAQANLCRYFDRENTFDYAYERDAKGFVIKALDKKRQKVVARSFDGFGHMLSQSWDDLNIGYCRDLLGRKKQLMLPDQSSILYQHGPLSLLSVQRLSKRGELLYQHDYLQNEQHHRQTEEKLIDGSILKKTRDAMGRYLSIESPFWSLEKILYDRSQQVYEVSERDFLGKRSFYYSHDGLSQLVEEKGEQQKTFYFNAFGNSQNHEWDSALCLSKDQNYQYSYDAAGFLLAKKSAKETFYFSYDSLGRMIEWIKEGERRSCFTYDPFDRRILTEEFYWQDGAWVQQGILRSLYDGNQEIACFDELGNLEKLRVLGKGIGQDIGAAIAIELGSLLYMPLHDQRGSVRCLVDPKSQQVIETYRYSAFGEEEIFQQDGEKICRSGVKNPWRFMSRHVFEDTGFVDFGRRNYDPKIARWIQPDPLGVLDGLNTYVYAHNKPFDEIDLLGHFSLGSMWREVLDLGKRSCQIFLDPIYQGFLGFVSGSQAYLERARIDGFWRAIYLPMAWHQGVIGSGEATQNLRITYTHGIRTDEEECRYVVSTLSKAHGGVNFHYLGQTATPFSRDIYNAILVVHTGVEPPVAQELAKKWKGLLEEMGSDGKILHYAHSHGGKITFFAQRYLSEEERARIEVRTFGSACILDQDAYGKVMNYVSRLDPFPVYCDLFHQLLYRPFSCLRSYSLTSLEHVTALEDWLQRKYSFFETWASPQPLNHSIRTPICTEAMQRLGQEFITTYGSPELRISP